MRRSIGFVAFPALVLFGCWVAVQTLANVFESYDDEGVLMFLRSNPQGMTRYPFSLYGPVFYLTQHFALAWLHVPATHDGGRMVTLLFWLAAAAAGSGMVYRYSRDLALSGVAFAAICLVLRVLADEPGHPQQIVIFLLLMAGFASTYVFDDRARWPALFALGAIGAALLLTKINVGAFYLLALCAAILTFTVPRSWRRAGWIAGAFVYGSAPLLLMHSHWSNGFLPFSLLMAASLILLAYASAGFPAQPRLLIRASAVAAAGFLLAAGVTIGGVMGQGVSPVDLLKGAFAAALTHAGNFFVPFRLSPTITVLCVFELILTVAWIMHTRGFFRRAPWLSALPVAGALGLPLVLVFNSRWGVTFAALLLPLGVCRRVPEEQARGRFCVFFLTHLALLEVLQIYPVSGSQKGISAAVIVVWALIFLADSAGIERASDPGPAVPRFRIVSPALAALLVPLGLLVMRLDGDMVHTVPSDLPGSAVIHMEPEQAAVYRWMTLNLPEHCDTLFGMPGMASLNIWSGVPMPSSDFMTHWMSGLPPERQAAITGALRSHPHPCVVYCPRLVRFWSSRVITSADDPLQAYIMRDLHPVAAAGGYEIRVPDPAAAHWDKDLILTAPRELWGDAIGLPGGLFQTGANSGIDLEVRSGAHGLALQSSCVANSELPCLGIRSDKVTLGTAAKAAGGYPISMGDGRWHKIVLRESTTEWTMSVDGRVVSHAGMDRIPGPSPAYLLTGSGMLRNFVVWRGPRA
jgi:hypothetical protein